MVSVGLPYCEPALSAMLPGHHHHNSFAGPFYPAHQTYPQDYGFPQLQGFGSDALQQNPSWHLPYQQPSHRNTTSDSWTFPQTSTNFLNSTPTTVAFRDNCVDGSLETPISVTTEQLPGSPQSAVISSTHSPGDSSPKDCHRYSCYDWPKRPDQPSSPSDPLPNKCKYKYLNYLNLKK